MKKHFLAAALGLAATVSVFAGDSDPVLMTVDGKPVHVSEFEYLYNKNNSQQAQQQTLDQYLDMFIDYKLKVADAEHAGLQNTPEFKKEFGKFRDDLAKPYLRDTLVELALIEEAYKHFLEDVYVSHIMVGSTEHDKQMLDSLRNAIINGETSFEEVAEKYSQDRSSSQRGGRMGYVTPGRFPWPFEQVAYSTAVGEISPVMNSGFGYHIIRPESRRQAAGEVNASHILMLTRGMEPAEVDAQKARIDSIYELLEKGADFADLATRLSQDPGSARNGGNLGWFSRGMMVSEFDSVAFALADGEISKPFATTFGYHIIKRLEHRDVPGKAELIEKIKSQMANDERANQPEQSYAAGVIERLHAKVLPDAMKNVRDMIAAAPGGYDAEMINRLSESDMVVAVFDGGQVTLAEVMPSVSRTSSPDADNARLIIESAVYDVLGKRIMDVEKELLAESNADYRNLVNEYRDGILLYEISNRNVWEKASKDSAGLAKFFKSNKKKYKWESPKFKSTIIFATSDSVLNLATAYADSIKVNDSAEFAKAMRERFGRDVKVERVIAAKGENAITDYLGFNGEKPEGDKKSRWDSYASYQGRIISSPEEPSDVRGQAVTDYQNYLEKQWLKQLHKKYKVSVDKKVFETLRK